MSSPATDFDYYPESYIASRMFYWVFHLLINVILLTSVPRLARVN